MSKEMHPSGASAPVFVPEHGYAEHSQIAAFMRYCEQQLGRTFADYTAFYDFSVADYRAFWRLFVNWSQISADGSVDPVCAGEACEDAVFFPALSLNYAEVLLSEAAGAGRAAITARHAGGVRERLTASELRSRVTRLSRHLARAEIRAGDRVVMVARNNAEAVIAALATASIGAVLSSCSPEMGAFAILSRFAVLEPAAMMCVWRTEAWDVGDVAARMIEVVRGLPLLKTLVALDDGPVPDDLVPPVSRLSEIVLRSEPDVAPWPRLPFNHPLFILFSSGTTGTPKCITHGAGGTLIEHLKEHRLHCDLRPEDKLFFQTSCAWMMWNWQLSALASGVELVLYDGPVEGPETLWEITAQEGVTVFGTSPAYLQWSERVGYAPGKALNLTALRGVLSTGSILAARQYDWVSANVKALPLQSISGGTDIVGCFVLGNPLLPVYRGEAQCRSLAMDVRALASAYAEDPSVGELVCANPFPSRPVGFFGDPDGKRFHAAYFAQNPGFWTHGDLISITPSGGVILHGRSDGVLNINGIRVGPAEVYRILEEIEEIVEAMAVEQAAGLTDSRMILLVVLRTGAVLDDALTVRIRTTLAQRGSSALVPSRIFQVEELPLTHSGKRSEAAARDVVNGRAARNRDALRNPSSLDAIERQITQAKRPELAGAMSLDNLEHHVQALCAGALGLSSIKTDDNFFRLGADSLTVVTIQLDLEKLCDRRLSIAQLFRDPTVRGLCAQVRERLESGSNNQGASEHGEGGLHIRAAEPTDIDAICHLLAVGFRSEAIPLATWRKLFDYAWMADKPNIGFVAIDGGDIVGFIGTIFADRVIDGQPHRMCNLTSWYVRPEYRGAGGYLLAEAIRDESIIYTAFTPLDLTQRALEQFGFERTGAKKRLIPPLGQLNTLTAKAGVTFDHAEIRRELTGEQARVFDDHLTLDCDQALLQCEGAYCLIVAKRRVWRKRLKQLIPIAIPYSDILYCSDPLLMVRHFEKIKLALFRRQRTLALMVDSSLLAAPKPFGLERDDLTMYRSPIMQRQGLDRIYSEFVLLPL